VADADPELALREYATIGVPRIEPILDGLIHESYGVRDGPRRYVLQRVKPIFNQEIHENIRAVVAHLKAKGVLTPELIPTRSGSWLAELPGHGLWRLWTWIDGASFSRCVAAAQAASAARLVARFHGALADLQHEFRPLGIPLHDTQAHLDDLAAALRTHPQHRLHGDVRRLADEILTRAKELPRLDRVSRRPAHGDLKFNNVRFAGTAPGERDQARSLVDLDTLSKLPLWAELGDAWRSWCNRRSESDPEAELDPELLEAALGSYLDASELALGREERASLAYGLEWISLELAARFAADALQECYFGWDPKNFPGRGEHNLCRARGQLALHRQAREARALQQRLLA
jgi:Ser/Thr protein kinase RdoA (MazF antagonist)